VCRRGARRSNNIREMKSLHFRIEDKIAMLEFDEPDSVVNVLSRDTMQELAGIINQLTKRPKSKVKALLITSKKEGIFIAGADIKEIDGISSSEEAREKAEEGKRILNNLYNLDIITLAVINGACLGGGLELALCCKYRVASFSERVKLGFPEVKLGILPGWGGTQRLPRLIGLTPALNMILSGRLISGKEALKYGLVDKLFPQARLIEDCIDFVNGLIEGKIHVKRKRKKIFSIFLEDTPLGRIILFRKAKKNILKNTRGFYPAPLRALEVIKRTYGRKINTGFMIESKVFSELALTEVSKNLIKVFFLNEEFKKLLWVDEKIKAVPINKCGIVGAGVMGGGIAQLFSYHDIPTRLKDINYEPLKKALKAANTIFGYALRKRRLRPHQVAYKLGLISPTTTYKGLENCDIIIEAVVEDLNIKQKVFKELGKIVSSHTILASNTSTFPIINMAEATGLGERVVGMHFFNPVHRMPLVEVIRSAKTSEETLATVIAFARKLGKTVIVVKDVPGFLINRILLTYLNESGFLIEEGMRIEEIDRIARRFGMPMGPLELIDEVGIDVGYKVAKILEDCYGARFKVCPALEDIRSKGLLGKKKKIGFYIHKGKKKKPNSYIYRLLKSPCRRKPTDDIACKRMFYVMINEAARCLQEKVVDRPQTIDIGMIMGTGFPPFRAGLLRYADSVGIVNIVKDLENFHKLLKQERFKPCSYLVEKAEKGESFY
jgi:3-hydroxyacyl-CoA dehydrogenase/enoyl-CoA hydratase/3-hydroxybutyryl-CoA epimerase